MIARPTFRIPVVLLTLSTNVALAQNDAIDEVIVEGRSETLVGEARTASEGIVGQVDLELRALLRPGDILESIPGMIVTQHSGSGKSNQMFLRGFNLDHGTDFATWIDGMPVNMRTHGHGQGYTDVNFLIPETIKTLRFVKGPYHAELGDFSSAGGTHVETFDNLQGSRLKLGVGDDGYRRVLGMGGLNANEVNLFAAIDAHVFDGAWTDIAEDVRKISGLVKLSDAGPASQWELTAMYYDNNWNSADQIPARAVLQGLTDERGSLDDTLGGESRRASLSGQYRTNWDIGTASFSAYVIDYRMQLWSNFTYLLDDPVSGDQFEQLDDRTVWGGSGQFQWFSGDLDQLDHRIGIELRYDDIDAVGLFHTRERERLATTREDSVQEKSIGLFYEQTWHFAERWRTVIGMRGDFYDFDVAANNPTNSGTETDFMLSPKGSLIYALSDSTETYLSVGQGFHSNDARGTTITVDPATGDPAAQVDPLVRSTGAEIGFKTVWQDSWNSSLALWHLKLDSELLFVGDAGTTEASRPSTRWGIELNNHWTLNDIWTAEADFAWTDAEFDDDIPDGKEIPGAIPFVATASLTAHDLSGWFGSIRVRHFSSYPLSEDSREESDGSTITSLAIGWRNETWKVQLDVLNVFDSNDHDIDYYYASRLPGEPADGIEDMHYKVFEPRQLRAYVEYRF
ncbi:TonB-dependent receptor [Woeseia oceani]|uniref:TonB-dependent receptor n=1 Tax=Woeseia oceani TaxID=1548547 RepID=A0A193LE75_9GAMM|nr:TonB-dependent receptor [Woeseia oceani]ANO50830.1 TonB-dependent receptor [Woeseia oceani]